MHLLDIQNCLKQAKLSASVERKIILFSEYFIQPPEFKQNSLNFYLFSRKPD